MNKLIAIVGPTAVGKTALSFYLAAHYETELISGDAYQIYIGMDIGTAKPTAAERGRYVHHLIDIAQPDKPYSAARFCEMAGICAKHLNQAGKLPILVGGTGLYVQSFLEGFSFAGSVIMEKDREKARAFIKSQDEAALQIYITKNTDWSPPDWHELFANTHRLVRLIAAIEKGEGWEFVRSQRTGQGAYDAYVIGLRLPRKELYQRIEQRVDSMLEAGWLEETERLLKAGISPECQAMKAIGYQELAACIRGNLTLSEAAAQIKQRTRRFAKRQLTWFKRMPYIHWYDKNQYSSEEELAAAVLADTDVWLGHEYSGSGDK